MKWFGCAACVFLFIFSGGTFSESANLDAQLVEWEQADKIIPRFSKFTVYDYETGMEFKVQRRAGSGHADAQPLSRKDTAIMKEIFGGEWSWKRRAIIVKTGKKRLAASMHGMPHGAGALENGFPGHFCIHFYGSKTHKTKSMDLSHKMMILKSAGRIGDYLVQTSAEETTDVFLAALKQEDKSILSMLSLQENDWSSVFSNLENLSFEEHKVKSGAEKLGAVTVPVKMKLMLKEAGQKNFKSNVRLVKFSPDGPWRVDADTFIRDFKHRMEQSKNP